MLLTVFFLVFLAESANCSWDVAVLTSTHLELLNGSLSDLQSIKFGVPNVKAIAYDPFNNDIYFSGNISSSYIFRKKVFRDGRTTPLEQLVKEQPGSVEHLVYDAKTNSLFWTIKNQIFRGHLDQITDGLIEGNVIYSVECDNCHITSLAIDSCSRHIYWSYYSYIKRMNIDATSHSEETIFKEPYYYPAEISISIPEGMIYWWDHSGNVHRLQRGSLDGSMTETLLNSIGSKYQFNSLVAATSANGSTLYLTGSTKENIYSREVNKLWILTKDSTSPKTVFTYEEKVFDVIVADIYKDIDNSTCSHLISMREKAAAPIICVPGTTFSPGSCTCPPGYFGNQCEKSVCYNYCLRGSCTVDDGKPICDCPPERHGERCELSCTGYCYKGSCNVSLDGELTCKCSNGWYGDRCDKSEKFCAFICATGLQEKFGCNCNLASSQGAMTSENLKNAFEFALIGVSAALILSVLVITFLICRLKRKPRMKRLYKVTPHKPAAPQQARTSPDCEIAIENCCNMNICETPCYEPELRSVKGKTKKEEHKSLLKEMEVQPNSGLTF